MAQALCQDNKSAFPFSYHDVPTDAAATTSTQQSLSWEANFSSVTFQNLIVVNMQNTSLPRCNAVEFDIWVTIFRAASATAFYLMMQHHFLIRGHTLLLFPTTRLRAGQSEIRIPLGTRDFLFSKMSRLAPEPVQSPIQWAPEVPCRGKATESRCWPLTSILCRG